MKFFSAFIIFILGFVYCFSQSVPGTLHCFTVGSPDGSQTQYDEIGYYINYSPIEYSGCQTNPAIIVAVIDSFCQPWNTCDHNFGQMNWYVLTSGTCNNPISGYGFCRNRPENYFIFRFDNFPQMDSLLNMLNSVPNGNYILAYTWYTYSYSIASPSYKQAFQNLGATQISSMPDSVPYIFFIKKGDPATLQEIAGTNHSDTLNLYASISCNTSSISEIENEKISIFPNPVGDFLYLKCKDEKFTWEIFNVAGQMILSGKIDNEKNRIESGQLASGVYMIQLENKEKNIGGVFVKR